jgi:hypothetical protein
MPTVEEVRKSMGEVGEGGGLLQGAPASSLDGDLPLDYTERVQSFFPECKISSSSSSLLIHGGFCFLIKRQSGRRFFWPFHHK